MFWPTQAIPGDDPHRSRYLIWTSEASPQCRARLLGETADGNAGGRVSGRVSMRQMNDEAVLDSSFPDGSVARSSAHLKGKIDPY